MSALTLLVPANVKTYFACGHLRLVDMTDAGRRGRKCRKLVMLGTGPAYAGDSPERRLACAETIAILDMAHCAIGDDYDTLRQRVIDAVDAARALGVAESWLRYFEEDVRGVDAPQIQLTAGKVGVWSGTADEDGIVLEDLKDTNNLPRTITHDQTNGAAYAAAAKCWSKVKLAESMHEAAEILRGAGARLHYFCAMD